MLAIRERQDISRAQDHFESLNLQAGNGTLPIIMCLEMLQI